MSQNKTTPNDQSVEAFIDAVDDAQKRKDSYAIVELMKDATGCEPIMWGSSIVGFGTYHYKYESGREGDYLLVGFSPRKQNLSLYGISSEIEGYDDLMGKLGKYTTGKSCVYIKRLSDVDIPTLKRLIEASAKLTKARYDVNDGGNQN